MGFLGKGCKDCGCFKYEALYYMVNDKVWEESNGLDSLLCLYCLSKRLGRKLTRSDFKDIPMNKPIFSILDCVDI